MGAAGAQTVDTSKRLASLRELMVQRDNDVQAFVVPSEDQHSSEYLAHCDERRAFISGFNGSAGCAVVTPKDAYLFTDGRYFLQAAKQLDQNWTLMKQGLPDVPTWQDFLSKNLDASTRIGIDATLISASDAETINKALAPRGSKLVSIEKNLVDAVWEDRPPRPQNPVFHLDEKYSGQSPIDKITALREELAKKKHQAFIVTMLDEVAWLFNLRGSDIDYNPVFFAYAIVTADNVDLFIENAQLDDAARDYLRNIVNIRPYDSFFDYLKQLPAKLTLNAESKILLGDKASLAIADAIDKDNYAIARSPVADLKAIKNATELEGFRQSHIRDGAALARYFAWLEEQLENGIELNESQGADKLEEFRSELSLFKGLSFTTISSTGPNAAVIHYSPDPADCAIIKKDQIYLCDSGAQFLDGTTDTTRTWHFGTPTDEEKRAFTRVLQGHISIDTAVFPSGTTGYIIDSFARRALWQDGLDYRHGTGHGVGHFLNVHEGPHGIGVRISLNSSPLKAGMTVSNEPGYYADGRFGIRIENIVLVREVKTPNNFGDKGYLGFEHVTLCPIQKKLVDTSLLTQQERTWLNEYHTETWTKVSPLLQNDQRALKWLERECSPLT
ncbi:putative Xaa-Pro aminopeptidase P [Hypsizygus marmoreus]|uniref:Xaa-Pro aminopeptidase P n=1 Tax=Hypsizygus marmoreus TaxID=39966 RepID=A0A369K6M0_HYPMA|nr:putative Xaa-Pro aminopeptidase P [Hypsizygus marmoreus]